MSFRTLALLGTLVFITSACTSTIEVSHKAPEPQQSQYSEYNIGIGDQLAISVWRNQELSMGLPVRPDGKISLPLIGEIEAAGKSASQLSQDLHDALISFIRNPQVTVIVTNASSTDFLRRVRLTGAVDEPLSIPHREGMTILDLVLQAGGLSEFAVPNKTVLFRRTDSGVKAYGIRLGDILNKGKLDTNYDLVPSDIVTVPERSF